MLSKKIRVLVVSYLSWRNDINVGNTLSNLFDGLQDKIEFANVFFKGGIPQNSVVDKYFYISEMELIKSIISRESVGYEIEQEYSEIVNSKKEIYDKARQMRWESMLLFQDIIGICGKWKSNKLEDFIEKFKPDIIFGPLGRVPVANILMKYVHDKYKVPIIVYAWDDHYSLNKKSLSPMFWIKTFLERRYIKQCANVSEFIYTITEQMKEEYRDYFQKECKVLYKAYEFTGVPPIKKEVGKPIKIVYMGNIGSGRWKVLTKIISVLESINIQEKKAELFIYTMSPKSKQMIAELNVENVSQLMDPVKVDDILKVMNSADILLHVEPMVEKERLFYRLSFSTKIVDYLYSARCILAVGGETAAMKYLRRNNAAVVVNDVKRLGKQLEELINSEKNILQYGLNAWECGVNNHQKKNIQMCIYNDFKSVLIREH